MKQQENGFAERYNVRLVVKGYSQEPGTDFSQIYAPVIKYATLRLVLAWVAQHRLHMLQFDVEGDIQKKLYNAQPEVFVQPSEKDKVMRFHKTLYGLR